MADVASDIDTTGFDGAQLPDTAAASTATVPLALPLANAASGHLPIYMHNLLGIGVPVSVTLAAKKQPLKQIMELAPGSLIQFTKSCDQLLDLCVGDQRIAQGMAVKVGEKFGLKINNLTPPTQRMQAIRASDAPPATG
jgi:flagellar motor switch protein FliN